jgi:hypothetical protein
MSEIAAGGHSGRRAAQISVRGAGEVNLGY